MSRVDDDAVVPPAVAGTSATAEDPGGTTHSSQGTRHVRGAVKLPRWLQATGKDTIVRHHWTAVVITYRWWMPLITILVSTSVQFVPGAWLGQKIAPVGDVLLWIGALLGLLAASQLLIRTATISFHWICGGLLAATSCLAAGGIVIARTHLDSTAVMIVEAVLGVGATCGLVWQRLARDTPVTRVQWAWIGVAMLIMFVPLWGTLSLVQQSQVALFASGRTVPGGSSPIPFISTESAFCRKVQPPGPVVVVSIGRIDPQAQAVAATAVLSVPATSIGLSSDPSNRVRHGTGKDIGFIRLILRRNYDGTAYTKIFKLDPSLDPIEMNAPRMNMFPIYVSEPGISKSLGCPDYAPFGAVTFGVNNEPELPVETDESLYPWDRYRFDYTISIAPLMRNYLPYPESKTIDRGHEYTLAKKCPPAEQHLGFWQNPDVYVVTTANRDNLVQVAPWHRNLCTKPKTQVPPPEIVVRISRVPLSILFVESIALVPLVLFILVLKALVRWSTDSGPASDGSHRTETVALIGAAILAILPLRMVIVPSEITGLTRVDFELGLWLSAIIALAVLEVAVNVEVQPTAPRNAAASPDPAHTSAHP